MDGMTEWQNKRWMEGWMDETIEQVDRIMNFETMELFVYFAVYYKKIQTVQTVSKLC